MAKKQSPDLGKKVTLTNVPLNAKGMGNYGHIDFDLAVEAKKSNSTGGKGGIRIAIAEAHVGKAQNTISSTISRVKFTVEANF